MLYLTLKKALSWIRTNLFGTNPNLKWILKGEFDVLVHCSSSQYEKFSDLVKQRAYTTHQEILVMVTMCVYAYTCVQSYVQPNNSNKLTVNHNWSFCSFSILCSAK